MRPVVLAFAIVVWLAAIAWAADAIGDSLGQAFENATARLEERP